MALTISSLRGTSRMAASPTGVKKPNVVRRAWDGSRGKWPTGIAWAMFIILAMIIIPQTGLFGVRLGDTPEIQMGMVTVLGLSVVMVLIYLMAAGFTSYGLSRRKYALGLPDGSIRAMIALFLIVIFVMVSVYVFRSIGGKTGAVLSRLTTADVLALGARAVDVTQRPDSLFDVTLRASMTPAGEQLGLQRDGVDAGGAERRVVEKAMSLAAWPFRRVAKIC